MPLFSLIALMLVFGASLLTAVAVGAWLVHAASKGVSPLRPMSSVVDAVRRRFEPKEDEPKPEFQFPTPRQ